MRKIIDRKTYNTETAKQIGTRTGGAEFCDDFRYFWEGLYQTKNGTYFLAAHGNARSGYGDGRYPGEHIQPMTEAEALAWAESHLTADQIEAHFGQFEEA